MFFERAHVPQSPFKKTTLDAVLQIKRALSTDLLSTPKIHIFPQLIITQEKE